MRRYRGARWIHVTDGAPRNETDSRANGFPSHQAYRDARFTELDRAFHAAGLAGVEHECLGFADQSAAHHLIGLTGCVGDRLREYRPDAVFTHPYEGGHPDHDACAFAVHHAVAGLRNEGGLVSHAPVPHVIEATFYHAGPDGIETGCFLPRLPAIREAVYGLSEEEKAAKNAVLGCFSTQKEMLRYFSLEAERFRLAPPYDFKHPPHVGRTFYDNFSWGMTSRHFCELTAQAEAALASATSSRAAVAA